MPSDLLVLLPLLAGYLFVHVCYLTRLRAQALEGHRLVFEAAGYGIALFLLARVVALAAERRWPELAGFLFDLEGPARRPFVGTSAIMLFLTPAVAFGVNLVVSLLAVPKDFPDDKLIPFTKLLQGGRVWALRRSFEAAEDRIALNLLDALRGKELLCFYLRDRKVFLGFVAQAPNRRRKEATIHIIPVLSGYRDKDYLTVHWTSRYPADRYLSGKADSLDPLEFSLIFPEQEILILRPFDEEYATLIQSIGGAPPGSQGAQPDSAAGEEPGNPQPEDGIC